MSEIEQLQQAIVALETQRALLGDAIVDAGLAPIREKLALIQSQQTPLEQQRKLVTVLFADISGFTALAETLDAEEVTGIINSLWERLDAVILNHGGSIDKHIGDAIMAVWGSAAGREDDPEQALRAALAMQIELANFRITTTTPLQMRIGLHTGPVVLSPVGTVGEFTVMGDTVNLASRLEHAAPIGGILISHETYRHVRGLFNLTALEPITVKGKAEPVRLYRVESAKPRAFRTQTRGVEGIETRMIGRDHELNTLQQRFEQISHAAQSITVVGHAGVGKSRLMYEFQNWLELLPLQIQYLKGRATEQTQSLPFALLRDMIGYRFHLMESDNAATICAKFEHGVQELLGADQIANAHILGTWLGYDFASSPHLAEINDPRRIRDQAMQTLKAIVETISHQGPLVILLEDLHWADARSLAAIQQIIPPNAPIFLLILTRPILFETIPNWGQHLPQHLRLDLHRLSEDSSRQLAAEILQKADHVPDALYDLIAERAEGNPFYVEELIKMFIDDQIIDTTNNQWTIDPRTLIDLRVPTTLTGVLQARLDGLHPNEKLTLQRASVIGRMFWEDALAFLQTTAETVTLVTEKLPYALTTLRSRELIYQHEQSVFEETAEYRFKHALLRDVTYESVLKRDRRIYHIQAAQWLTHITKQRHRSDEYAALIAEHYDQAGALHETATWYQRAGEQAQALYAPHTAIDYFSRAMAAFQQLGNPIPARLYQARGLMHETIGDFDAARIDHETIIEQAQQQNDQQAQWQALIDLGALWAGRDYQYTGKYYQQALDLARKMNDLATLGYTLSRLGNWYSNTEQFLQAQQSLEESLSIFRKLDDQSAIASTLDLLGMMSALGGNLIQASHYYDEAITLFRKLTDRQGLINCLASIVIGQTYSLYCSANMIDPKPKSTMLDLINESLQIAESINWKSAQAYIHFHFACIYGAFGEIDQALQSSQRSIEIATAIGHYQWMTASHFSSGMAYLEIYALDEAEAEFKQAFELAQQINSAYWICTVNTCLAFVFIRRKEYQQAQTILKTYDSHPDHAPLSLTQRLLCFARTELALARNDPQTALQIIDQLQATEPNLTTDAIIPSLWLQRAKAYRLQQRLTEAEALLHAAYAQTNAVEAHPLSWKIAAELGNVYSLQGQHTSAQHTWMLAETSIAQISQHIHNPILCQQFLHITNTLLHHD